MRLTYLALNHALINIALVKTQQNIDMEIQILKLICDFVVFNVYRNHTTLTLAHIIKD